MSNSFNDERLFGKLRFSVFIVLAVAIYIVLWRLYFNGMLEELWRYKTWLAAIPPMKLLENESMRQYVDDNSSGNFSKPNATD